MCICVSACVHAWGGGEQQAKESETTIIMGKSGCLVCVCACGWTTLV